MLLVALALASTTISVPARTNANVSIAADGTFVALTWSAATSAGLTDIYSVVSTDGGRTFAAPVRVNDVDGDARVNGEQPPRIALNHRADKAPVITVVWPTKGASGTKLLSARSDDGGRTFGKSATVPDSDAPGSRGWQGISANAKGGVDVLWLDHRALAGGDDMASMHHEMSAEKPDGVAMAQKSKLYFSTLDGSAPPHAITGGVCYCCKTAIVAGRGDAVYAAWRHVYPGNLRDMAFTMSMDGGKTFAPPIRVSEDKWVLEGCPDDGPSMVVDAKNRIHIAWPTLVQNEQSGEPNLGLFYATSADGKTFSPRQRIPTQGTPHHPQLALAGDKLVLAWDELENGKRRVVVAHGDLAGSAAQFTREVISDTDSAIYPMAAATNDGDVILAYTSGGPDSVIRVSRLK